jgi:hypothetical protein
MAKGFAYVYAETGSGVEDLETVSTPRSLLLSHKLDAEPSALLPS